MRRFPCCTLAVCLLATLSQALAAEPKDSKDETLPAEARARLGNVRFLHPGAVTSLAFSPDGKLLASSGADGSAYLWDAQTGKLVHALNKSTIDQGVAPIQYYGNAGTIAFSADGKLIGSVQLNKALRLWDTETGKLSRTLFENMGGLSSFAISPDGKTIIPLTGQGKSISLCDADNGKTVRSLEGHAQPINAVAFSADGKLLVSGSEDQTIRVWDLETGKEKLVIEGHRDGVRGVAITPDGKLIASFSSDGTARTWKADTGDEVKRIEGPRGVNLGVGFSRLGGGVAQGVLAITPDGKHLAASALAWSPRLYEIATGKEIFQADANPNVYNSAPLALRPDGKVLAFASQEGRIRFRDVATGAAVPDVDGHVGSVNALALSPDGKTLVTGGADRTLRVWDLATLKETQVLRGHTGSIAFVAFTPDGKQIISASNEFNDKVISIWDAAGGKEDKPIRVGNSLGILSIAMSPDGKKLATSSQDGVTRILSVPDRKEITFLRGGRGAFQLGGLVFTPDSKGLIAPGANGALSVWDAETGAETRPLTKQPVIGTLSASPDGKQAVAFGYDGTIRLMDLEKGKDVLQFEEKLVINQFQGKGRFVAYTSPGLAFSPDGKTVATPWKDNSIRLWEIATGKIRHAFVGHSGGLTAMAFARDGQSLISCSSDGTVLVWDMRVEATSEPLAVAELNRLWEGLGGESGEAFKAVRRFAAAGKEALPFLKEHVKPVASIDDKKIEALIADLDSQEFDTRRSATESLEKIGELAEPALRRALDSKPSLEMAKRLEELLAKVETKALAGELLRDVRAIEALEKMGTPEARKVLRALAEGTEGARLTREAKAALARMGDG